jgi:hypothetical protein
MSSPDSTPQRHAAVIPGIKLSHRAVRPSTVGSGGTEKCTYNYVEERIRRCLGENPCTSFHRAQADENTVLVTAWRVFHDHVLYL